MGIHSEKKFARMEDKRESRVEHSWNLFSNPTRARVKPSHHKLSQHATTATVREVHADPVPYIGPREDCAEKGCIFPVSWVVFDQWGEQLYCNSHKDAVIIPRSLEDREHPLSFRDDPSSGKGGLDGVSIGRLPQPQFFGLRVQSTKLITFGRLVVSGMSLTRASSIAGLSAASGKAFAERSALPILFNARRDERQAKRLIAKQRADARRDERQATRALRGCTCLTSVHLQGCVLKRKTPEELAIINAAFYAEYRRQERERKAVALARRQKIEHLLAGMSVSSFVTRKAIREVLVVGPVHKHVIADCLGVSVGTTQKYLSEMCRDGTVRLMALGTATYGLGDSHAAQ